MPDRRATNKVQREFVLYAAMTLASCSYIATLIFSCFFPCIDLSFSVLQTNVTAQFNYSGETSFKFIDSLSHNFFSRCKIKMFGESFMSSNHNFIHTKVKRFVTDSVQHCNYIHKKMISRCKCECCQRETNSSHNSK